MFTVNPRISPWEPICENESLGGGLCQSLAFSSKFDKKRHNILNELNFQLIITEADITKVAFLFAFLPPFKGSSTVELLSCEAFLKYDIILQFCFPRISPHGGLFKGSLFARMTFYLGAYSRGGSFEDLRYVNYPGKPS